MTDQIRVNVRTTVNSDMIRRETRNGRDVIIVRSATLPDDIVMNGIKYPSAEIEKSYRSLENTPAPLGHPTINGEFVSAKSPLGITLGWIGAHNENVTRKDGRVWLDKVIDVTRANESEGGRRVIEALNGDDPIHTSTGLMCYVMTNSDGEKEAFDMEFDHDAILLDEDGAGTPDQGVGMMVNAKGEKLAVINSTIEENFDREVEWAISDMLRAVERRDEAVERQTILDRIKTAITEAIGFGRETSTETNKDFAMTDVSKEQFEELSAKVNGLTEALDKLDVKGAIDNAVAPLIEAANAEKENKANAEAAEKATLVEAVVKANKLTEAVALTLPVEALRELANAVHKSAAPLSGGFTPKQDEPVYKSPLED